VVVYAQLKPADPNVALPTGETPPMTAARTGRVGAVNALLAQGADVHAKERSLEQTALMWAVSERQTEVARILIEHGADAGARSKRWIDIVAAGGPAG
jgi:ankyrin repeat protein